MEVSVGSKSYLKEGEFVRILIDSSWFPELALVFVKGKRGLEQAAHSGSTGAP